MTSVPVARGPKGVKLCACNDGFTETDVTDNCDVNSNCTNDNDSFSCASYNGTVSSLFGAFSLLPVFTFGTRIFENV